MWQNFSSKVHKSTIFAVFAALILQVVLFSYVALTEAIDINDNEDLVELTDKEIEWLDEHPDITLAYAPIFEPSLIVEENGELSGILIDIYSGVEERLGLEINIEIYDWVTAQEKVISGEVDGLLTAAEVLNDKLGLLSTSPTYVVTPTVYASKSAAFDINNISDLRGKSVVTTGGTLILHELLEPYLDDIDLQVVDNPFEAMALVLEGSVELYLGLSLDNYIIEKNTLIGIEAIYIDIASSVNTKSGIRSDWPELLGIINKGLASFSQAELNAITKQWTNLDLSFEYELTSDEKAWLEEHSEMRLGIDTGWLPFDYIGQSGDYEGICSDYVNILSEKFNVDMIPEKELTWLQMIEQARNGEIDVIPCLIETEERREFLLFSEPYISLPAVLVTRDDSPLISSLEEIQEDTIAVVEGYATEELLKSEFPTLDSISYGSIEEALLAVSTGKADWVIDTLPAISYGTRKQNIDNLHTIISLPYSVDLSFAVRKDWPELVPILNRALASIPEDEKNDIFDKWINVRFETRTDFKLFVQIILGVIGLGAFISFMFALKNIALTKEINKRKHAEEKLQNMNQHLDVLVHDRTAELAESNKRLKELGKLKNKFISIVSHQLRTPLTAIRWNLELILSGDLGEMTDTQSQFIKSTADANKNIILRLNDLLIVLDIEKGRLAKTEENISIGNLCSSISKEFEPKYKRKEIEFSHYLPEKEIPMMNLDPRMIRAVFGYLLDNAIKYTKKGGQISTKLMYLTNKVRFEITDNGIGIPDAEQSHIFEKFYRGTNASLMHTDASGIGLSIAKYYIESHSGVIGFESKDGIGSTFWFELPIEKEGGDQ